MVTGGISTHRVVLGAVSLVDIDIKTLKYGAGGPNAGISYVSTLSKPQSSYVRLMSALGMRSSANIILPLI